ncbi:hypothetical protein COCOBI_01-1160 [Coccomyxa sp. Obi]|nr:hypothetical protein COCOBI_01-1160 [Coccomyxa sp. Obi]
MQNQGRRRSRTPDDTGTAGTPASPSGKDGYYMPPHLAPPSGYKPEPLPPPTLRKTEPEDWQGIPHLRKIGPEEEHRILTRTGPINVLVHGVPAHCKRSLEDIVRPVEGFQYMMFYSTPTSRTGMAILVFADQSAGEEGCKELVQCFRAPGMTWRPEKIMMVQRQGTLTPSERLAKLKALQEAPNPERQGGPCQALPALPTGSPSPPPDDAGPSRPLQPSKSAAANLMLAPRAHAPGPGVTGRGAERVFQRRRRERASPDRTHCFVSQRPRKSPSPMRTFYRGAGLDQRPSGWSSVDMTRRVAGSRGRRSPSSSRGHDSSRTWRDGSARERSHSVRGELSRERERRSADGRAAPKRPQCARTGSREYKSRSADSRAALQRPLSAPRSRSPDRQRGNRSQDSEPVPADTRAAPKRLHLVRRSRSPNPLRGSRFQERERLPAETRAAPKRPHSARRSRSPDRQRDIGSREREHHRPDDRPPKKLRLRFKFPVRRPPPNRTDHRAAERRDGPAQPRKSGHYSAEESERSAPAHKRRRDSMVVYVPPGARAERKPLTAMADKAQWEPTLQSPAPGHYHDSPSTSSLLTPKLIILFNVLQRF